MTAKKEIQIPNNWRPRLDQWPLWEYLQNGGKRAVQVAHRRWGKDDVALHFTSTQIMQYPGNYWHMLPQYNQARKVVWDAINPLTEQRRIDEAFPKEIRVGVRRQEMSIEFVNGSIWQLVGSDNYNAYVGSPPRGLVISEWAVANPMAWAYLSPILEQNEGWALFIYTSRGNNHGKTTYDAAKKDPDWFASRLPATATPVFTPDQLIKIKEEYIQIYGDELGIALYEQEYMCSWQGAVLGAYYAVPMREARDDGRITEIPYQVGLEVDTFWDLGMADAMAIWFMQPTGSAYHFIDYYEGTGYGFEHYAKVLKEKGYVYGNHYMPHDIRHREFATGEIAKTRKQVAEDLGIRPVLEVERPQNMELIIKDQIPAVRRTLSRCYFDEKKCAKGLAALEQYHAEYDAENKVLNQRPEHDWSSHAADAIRTFAVGYRKTVKTDRKSLENYRRRGSWMTV